MAEWVALCRRTEDPKLAYIEGVLTNMGIPHQRNGSSFWAPILQVPENRHDEAYTTILLEPDDEFGIFDEIPDDHRTFVDACPEAHDWLPEGAS